MSFSISVPNPCHEDWNKMIPDERGAFCGKCKKSVWDFTDKTPDEIRAILLREAHNNPCGLFRKEHLAQPTQVKVPLLLLNKKMPLLSRFAVAAFIVFGASLLSFTTANGQSSKSPIIIVDEPTYYDSTETREYVTGIPPNNHWENDTLGGIDYYDYTTQLPEFPGGDTALMEYLKTNLRYPEDAIEEGTVYVQFIINREGAITSVEVLKGVSPRLDKQVVRVIESMPHWKPGKQNGYTVPVNYVIPVVFRIE